LAYYWIPNTPIADSHGHWAWVDGEDNLLVVQATGTAERGRSHAMVGGRTMARFRLGSAWDDERDNQYVTIPRTRDALIVILPDGRWQPFPLGPGQAAGFFRGQLDRDEPSADLLRDAGALLDEGGKAEFESLLKEYVPPKLTGPDASGPGDAPGRLRK
jgi:hypothetical protein